MITEALIEDWNFLQKCGLVLDGNALAPDAEHMLGMFANGQRVEVGRLDGMAWLDFGDPLQETIWWAEETKRFYLGALADFDGSIST